ncbi:MAG: AAA family ATPase, partial [Leptospiraceae bacterium]|nr:AAA family ATPase [Leptospiraceae bacterium]
NSLKEEFRKYSEVGNRKEKGLLTEDAKFSLVYKKNQTGYKINWALKSDQMHPIESFNGSEWVKEEGSIKDRFPISIYSQKQIYSFAENPKHLLDMISDQKQIGYKEWLDKKNILEANFFSYKNRLRELSLLLEKESALKGELSDVTKKISLLEEKGFQEILNEFQKRQNQSGYMDAWESNIFSLPEKIGILEEEIVPLSYPEEMIDEKDTTDVELLKMIQTFNSDLNKLKSLLITQKDQLTVSLQKWNDEKQNSIWFKKFQESIKQYEETLKELSTGSINAQDEFGKMFQIKHNLETSLQKIEFTKVECERVKRDIEKTLNEIVEHRKLLSTQRQNFLNEVFKTNQSVKIRLIPFGNKIDVESQLREILRMESGFEPIIGSMESNEGFIFDLYENGIDESKISNLKGKLLGLLEGKDFSAIGRYNQFKERILKLTSQSIDQLELYFPDDSLAIEYKNASGKYQPIEQGSPGQKTAALLSFVLSYGNDPIILDQPEDDLDNRLIYELIVKQLKESKSKRQIIVVTHNANIVVNGDSELVFCLSSNGQTCLSSQGCLQDKKIREEICSILEGGKDAFQLRYKRIEPHV